VLPAFPESSAKHSFTAAVQPGALRGPAAPGNEIISSLGNVYKHWHNQHGRLAIPHSTYRPTIRVVSSTCSSWHATDGTRVYTTPVFPGSLAGGFALSPSQTITSP
jgi:hypothetical protein